MKFFKMTNLGNNYIFTFNKNLSKRKIKKICSVNYGVGADGVVKIYKKDGLYGLEIYNSDGSYASFCGNATLSLGWYLYKNNLVKKEFSLLTKKGKIDLSIKKDKDNKEYICLKAINNRFYCSEKLIKNHSFINKMFKFNIDGNIIKVRGTAVNVNNLHLVLFGYFPLNICEKIVDKINKSGIFPNGVNVEFVKINKNKVKVIVFERGSGRTLCCGSGCTAIGFVISKILKKEGKFIAVFEGGNMNFEIKNGFVYLYSKPEFLFKGEV